MPTIEAIAARAEAEDGAAPLDEATLMALRDETAKALVRAGSFAVIHGAEVSLAVDPPVRGHGLGGALFAEVLATHPEVTQAWSHGNHPAAARLAARHGWARVRDLWVMRRPMTGPAAEPLPPVEAPDGVELGSWTPELRDGLLRVNAAAFADHPEQGAMDEANLAARMAEPWFDPEGLVVATDASGLLAFHWTKQHSAELGEVYVVGVDPAAQGRGLGRLVTLAGLHHLAGRGVDEVLLYVEADNAAAVATYSRLGFEHAAADTHVMYARASGSG